jgi:hypothetical protein
MARSGGILVNGRLRSWVFALGIGNVVFGGALVAACSSAASPAIPPMTPDGATSAPDGSSSGDPLGPGDTLLPPEHDVYQAGSDGIPHVQQLAQLADSLFDFDPTLDPTKTAGENVTAISGHASTNLGPSCGTVSSTTSSVTVAFGPPPGCTLANGITASGSVTASVSKLASTLTVTLTFTSLVVDGNALSGSASFATTTGTSFTVNATLTTGSTTYTATNLTITGSATKTITLDGVVTTGAGDGTTTATFAGVAWVLGECYPDRGTVSIRKGLITTVVTFSATTPNTGAVAVTVGKKTVTEYLPVYGRCGATDGGA